jgi:3-oxoadipate enol-lactonase
MLTLGIRISLSEKWRKTCQFVSLEGQKAPLCGLFGPDFGSLDPLQRNGQASIWPRGSKFVPAMQQGIPAGDSGIRTCALPDVFVLVIEALCRDVGQAPANRTRNSEDDVTSETTFIEAGGIRFRVRLDGPESGSPLMFSNSLGTSLEMWDAQAAYFARTFRVIRYDVRGHGESSTPPGPYSLAMLAQDALRILDALHIHKTDWVGCSLGGMVGMWLLTHHRERIGKAVLGNTSPFMGPPATDWNARIRMAHTQGMAPIAEAMKLRWFTKGFNETHPAEVSRITDQMLKASTIGYAACCGAIRDMDQRESVKGITNPVLVLIGGQDPATPPAMGEILVRNIPGAKKAVIPAAHISNCEIPDAYNAAIAPFLTK